MKVVDNPIIKPQLLNGTMFLGCDFCKCFIAFPPPPPPYVRQEGLGGLKLGKVSQGTNKGIPLRKQSFSY